MTFEKKNVNSLGLITLSMQKHFLVVSSFEHVNFAINWKISKTFMTIQILMLPLWFFKHTKMQFKKVSTHLGDSFDYVFNTNLNVCYEFNNDLMKMCFEQQTRMKVEPYNERY
jgi:hypothetical protein